MDEDSRVTVSSNGEFDEIHIDGLKDGSVAIDNKKEQPRLIVQVEDDEDAFSLAMDEGESKTYAIKPLTEDFNPDNTD